MDCALRFVRFLSVRRSENNLYSLIRSVYNVSAYQQKICWFPREQYRQYQTCYYTCRVIIVLIYLLSIWYFWLGHELFFLQNKYKAGLLWIIFGESPSELLGRYDLMCFALGWRAFDILPQLQVYAPGKFGWCLSCFCVIKYLVRKNNY